MEQIEQNIDNNVKAFWTYTKQNKKNSESTTAMEYNGQNIPPQDVATSFAQYFYSVYRDIPASYNINMNVQTNCDVINLGKITSNDYRDAVKKLKPKRSAGPDRIPPYIIKGCAVWLEIPLLFIFNLALKTNTFPDLWKEVCVTPIHKSASVRQVENYRPIAVLSAISQTTGTYNICKIME